MTRTIAILGGGISGLSAAYYLRNKGYKILIIEKQKRLGGWINTKITDNIRFEEGPRSLRPTKETIKLIRELGLEDQIVKISSNHEASQNRYILHHNKPTKLPHNILSLIKQGRDPLTKELLISIMKEPFQSKNAFQQDESISDFFKRRFGPNITTKLISGIFHGIYAGDISELSAHSLIPKLVEYESTYGSIFKSILFSKSTRKEYIEGFDDVSMYSFESGMAMLVNALNMKLHDQVQILEAEISTKTSSYKADIVISTLPAHNLANLIANHEIRSLLSSSSFVDVIVLNFAYIKAAFDLKGFGYLVPQSESSSKPLLGVVLDSCPFPNLLSQSKYQSSLTLMIGGHHNIYGECERQYWIKKAKLWLNLHLGILDPPDLVNFAYNAKCIPQYLVGHIQRLQKLNELFNTLYSNFYLAGASYYGVSVNECIKRSYDVSLLIKKGH